MSDYVIKEIKPFIYFPEDQNVYLVMVNAFRKPPHFVLNIGGRVYGTGVNGPTLEDSFERYLAFIRRKEIHTLFFQLKLPAFATLKEIEDKAKEIVLAYPLVDVGIATCLSPIKDFVREYYQTDTSNVNKIFDLFPKLEEQALIENVFQLNIDRFMINNEVKLKKYSEQDIADGINKFRKVSLV